MAHAGIAAASERRGQLAAARASYEQAIETIEQVRANLRIPEEKAGFFEDKVEVYNNLIALLVRSHDDAAAFRYVERARARSALDLMTEAGNGLESGLDPSLAERQRELQRRLSRLQGLLIQRGSEGTRDPAKTAALAAALEAADEEHRALRREIRDTHPRYADFRYPEPEGLAETKQLLGDKAVLLEYVVGKDGSFLFAVTRTDHLIARLPGAPALAPVIEKLREAVSTAPSRASLSTYWLTAQSLYRDLIAPARRLLNGRTEVIIAADGILHYLPFAALLKPVGEVPADIDPAPLPYLIRDYAISYVPSASVLATLRRHRGTMRKPEKALIAYADPAYYRGLQRLTHSRVEAQGIARLYPASDTDVFVGGSASEENVRKHALERYRFVHFAAHGLLNENNPQFSGLFLSHGKRGGQGDDVSDDGVLQTYEIFNLKLNAEMVMLSSCQTGLGKSVKGEGLVGLTQAFLYAGSSTVGASLWNVADHSTADLMVRFYRYMRTETTSKASALRRAQLDLISSASFAHPYYWAPFVLIGDSR